MVRGSGSPDRREALHLVRRRAHRATPAMQTWARLPRTKSGFAALGSCWSHRCREKPDSTFSHDAFQQSPPAAQRPRGGERGAATGHARRCPAGQGDLTKAARLPPTSGGSALWTSHRRRRSAHFSVTLRPRTNRPHQYSSSLDRFALDTWPTASHLDHPSSVGWGRVASRGREGRAKFVRMLRLQPGSAKQDPIGGGLTSIIIDSFRSVFAGNAGVHCA